MTVNANMVYHHSTSFVSGKAYLQVKYLTYPESVFGIDFSRCLEWKAHYEWDPSCSVTAQKNVSFINRRKILLFYKSDKNLGCFAVDYMHFFLCMISFKTYVSAVVIETRGQGKKKKKKHQSFWIPFSKHTLFHCSIIIFSFQHQTWDLTILCDLLYWQSLSVTRTCTTFYPLPELHQYRIDCFRLQLSGILFK